MESNEEGMGGGERIELLGRLEPREAFFGGRTNAVQLYWLAREEEGEEIRYVDYTSLYPWVNKTYIYPVEHSAIITQPEVLEEADVLLEYFGLVTCTVLAPYGLHFAVLPHRCGGKLTFPLCQSCVETQLPLPLTQRTHCCPHTPEERALTGTWFTPELKHQYINTFLKIKQEASGWLSEVGEYPEKRRAYVEAYEEKEGIRLDESKIEKNPGMRSLAKMMLNWFLGKIWTTEQQVSSGGFDLSARVLPIDHSR